MNTLEIWIVVVFVFVVISTTVWVGRRIEKDASGDDVLFNAIAKAGTTDWFPADVKPVHAGEYPVRMPLKSVTMVNIANWDGDMWRDVETGYPCYFQQVEWLGLAKQVAV
jgi:hypothetical protein